MKNPVIQVVRISGEVISPEEVEAIWRRLIIKILIQIEDQFDEIPLNKSKNLHKMIFKALF